MEQDLKQKARAFAVQRHGKQTYGHAPYSVHLDAVANIASAYGDQAMVIAYLHDVVEDTPTSLTDIHQHFGPFIAECVAIVSDEPGDSRAIRKAKTNQKMAQVAGQHELALVVKAADRLANLQASKANNSHKHFTRYCSEHAAFSQAVYRPHLCEPIWQAINAIIAAADPH